MSRKLKILFASSEVYPFAKTGGLADISGSLPTALKERGHDVRVITPHHTFAKSASLGIDSLGLKFDIPVGRSRQKGTLLHSVIPGALPIYFVENERYFHRKELYGENNKDYPDNAQRFIFFSRSVLEACKALDFQPDIIHCNDWHTGLIPAYLKTLYARDPWFKNTRTIFSIHNLGYQGNFKRSDLTTAQLPKKLFTPDGVEFYGHFSFLKSGIVFGDIVTTVSRTYCREIQTEEWGFGMDGILKKRSPDLYGIVNGVDYGKWDPAHDPRIVKQYGPKNLKGKRDCRRDLMRKLSLKISDDKPILSMITRLSSQKGIDLVMEGMEDILSMGAGFVLLGSGEKRYENYFRKVSRQHPKQCAVSIKFDENLAHRILAGSDMILVPSQYEPCGLTQMYGLKYGTVPVVRAVGGLHDTIKEFNPKTKKGTGFKFRKFESRYLLQSLEKALAVYANKSLWRRVVANGMAADYSWEQAARTYVRLYRKALTR